MRLICALLLSLVAGAAAASEFDLFSTGPPPDEIRRVGPDFSGDVSPYRARIEAALRKPPNFAAHYRLETWGCGASCMTGLVVDLTSAQALLLPTVCCSKRGTDATFEPIRFRNDSRVLVLDGIVDGRGRDETHLLVFSGIGFSPLHAAGPMPHKTPETDGITLRQLRDVCAADKVACQAILMNVFDAAMSISRKGGHPIICPKFSPSPEELRNYFLTYDRKYEDDIAGALVAVGAFQRGMACPE